MPLTIVAPYNNRPLKLQMPCRTVARKGLRPSFDKKKNGFNVSIILRKLNRNGRIISRRKLFIQTATTSRASRQSSTTWFKRKPSLGEKSSNSKKNVRQSNSKLLRL
jgi:hypothetical protein